MGPVPGLLDPIPPSVQPSPVDPAGCCGTRAQGPLEGQVPRTRCTSLTHLANRGEVVCLCMGPQALGSLWVRPCSKHVSLSLSMRLGCPRAGRVGMWELAGALSTAPWLLSCPGDGGGSMLPPAGQAGAGRVRFASWGGARSFPPISRDWDAAGLGMVS